jgi:hypothetical protein
MATKKTALSTTKQRSKVVRIVATITEEWLVNDSHAAGGTGTTAEKVDAIRRSGTLLSQTKRLAMTTRDQTDRELAREDQRAKLAARALKWAGSNPQFF